MRLVWDWWYFTRNTRQRRMEYLIDTVLDDTHLIPILVIGNITINIIMRMISILNHLFTTKMYGNLIDTDTILDATRHRQLLLRSMTYPYSMEMSHICNWATKTFDHVRSSHQTNQTINKKDVGPKFQINWRPGAWEVFECSEIEIVEESRAEVSWAIIHCWDNCRPIIFRPR